MASSASDRDDLRDTLRSNLIGMGLTALLAGWIIWIAEIEEYGLTWWLGLFSVFAIVALCLFAIWALRAAIGLRAASHARGELD